MAIAICIDGLVVGCSYPLRSPMCDLDLDPTMTPDGLPICSLLASDTDWAWVEGHQAAVLAAADIFVDAISREGAPAASLWCSARFSAVGEWFTLATRGGLIGGILPVAVLEREAQAV